MQTTIRDEHKHVIETAKSKAEMLKSVAEVNNLLDFRRMIGDRMNKAINKGVAVRRCDIEAMARINDRLMVLGALPIA